MNKYQEIIEYFGVRVINVLPPRNRKELSKENSILILELVDRATPKKIIRNNEQEDCDEYVITREYWSCSICKVRLLTGDNYCRKCGQAIDWSNELKESTK